MIGRDLARRPEPSRQTNVSGEVTMTRDELAIQLRPTSATERTAHEREPRTVITRPVPQPLVVPPAVYPLPPPGFDYARVGVPPEWHHLHGFAAHWENGVFDRLS